MKLLISFILLNTCLSIYAQEVVNGAISDSYIVITDNKSYSLNKNDTTFYPRSIIYSKDVRYVLDTIGLECSSTPGCIQIRPFDLYSAYFDFNYVVFKLSEPLIKGKTYELNLSVKKTLNYDKKQTRLPFFGVKISNSNFDNNYISYDDEVKIISSEGIVVNFADTLFANDFTAISLSFVANGSENKLIFGCFFKFNTDKKVSDIKFLNKKLANFEKNGNPKVLKEMINYFGFADEYSKADLIELIKSLEEFEYYETPSYYIDDLRLINR
jgi:hypothetical protein